MRTATVAAWLVVVLAIIAVSFAPITADQLPEGTRTGFRLGHVPAYALLAVLTLRVLLVTGLVGRFLPAVLIAGVATMLFGGCIELLQPYFGRSGSLRDFTLNGLGITVALVLVTMARGWLLRSRLGRELSTSD